MMPNPKNPSLAINRQLYDERSGDRARIERRERVAQAPMIRPGLLPPAGDIQNQPEQIPANFFDGRFSGCDATGVKIDEIRPALGERGSRRNLDDWNERQPVGSSLPRREQVHVHRSELLGAADEITSGCRSENQALGSDALAVSGYGHQG